MTGTIYHGTYVNGITLSNPATQNPATIAATGHISNKGIALLGKSGHAWTVTNLGTVDGKAAGIGIDLASSGSVTNGSITSTKALIEGDGIGIALGGTTTGTVTNFGTVGGGVLLGRGGTLTNFGTIEAGVYLRHDGSVTNGSSASTTALIEGDGTGISFGQGGTTTGTVTNFGTINAGSNGIFIAAGGKVANGSSSITTALIEGYADGVRVNNGVSTVINYGTIRSKEGTTGTGVNLQAGGVTNGSSASAKALIEGYDFGILMAGGSIGTVTNYGTIRATGEYGEGIRLQDEVVVVNFGAIRGGAAGRGVAQETGVIINGSSASTKALIEGGEDALVFYSAGTIANFGTIRATAGYIGTYYGPILSIGVNLETGGSVANGSNTSTKALIIGAVGIDVGTNGLGAMHPGTVTNYGTVKGTGTDAFETYTGIALHGGGAVMNGSAADRSAVASAVNGDAVAIGGTAGGSGTVTNFGTIDTSSTVNAALYLGAGGAVANGASASTAALIKGNADGILIAGGAARITNFGTVTGATGIAVAASDTAAVTLTNSGRIVGSGGTAVAFGGGNDVLTVEKGAVFTGAVEGGDGTDRIVQGSAGTLDMAGFSGFERIILFNGGADKLTLKSANFDGVTRNTITITDGNNGNTVSAAGVAAADRIVVHAGTGADTLTGGLGNDVFYAGGKTTMTGGAGINEFVFETIGAANFIKDFHVSAKNELVFSNAGFNLGLGGSTATPKKLTAAQATKLFVANTTGKFTNANQRLAYDTKTGLLFAGAHGSSGPENLVATLSDHASIAATQLFFIS